MPRTPDYFVGKTIVITGAASGIGKETALIFGREGANVLCADMNEAGAADAAEGVSKKGGRGVHMRVDVTSREQVFAMVRRAKERFGRVDFALNSAGAAFRSSDFLGIDEELLQRTFDLNVKGVFYSMQAVLPEMLENGKGVIVNMGSMAHRGGGGGRAVHYAATKGAVVTMSMGVGREYADRGIRCMSISPGAIETPFYDVSPSPPKEYLMDRIPMGRYGRPEEIGELVLFICSDACEFMTADSILVNGGAGWK